MPAPQSALPRYQNRDATVAEETGEHLWTAMGVNGLIWIVNDAVTGPMHAEPPLVG